MDDEKYIDAVKALLGSNKTVADQITEVASLNLPRNAAPLLVLVHGDSQELKSVTNYAENDDPSSPGEQAIKALAEAVATKIKSKLKRYVSDWNGGNMYRYVFAIKASYGAFKDERGDIEYVDIIQECPHVQTVTDAVKAARSWQSQLLEQIKLYRNQATEHKLISVKPTYTIYDKNLLKIATGTLQGDDEFGVSTWLNQN